MTMAIIGGILIGAAASALWLLEGRIAGVTGILAAGLDPTERGRGWRWAFVAGLMLGGAAADAIVPGSLPTAYAGSVVHLGIAGLLVGVGARLANGCTSGHALCGTARGSRRSVVAALTFVAFGMLTVLVTGTAR
jgi:uncharacterized membrane protein YedE/YeeE